MPRRYYRSRRKPMRRSRIGKGLTGGTGDVNPQWLTVQNILNPTGTSGTVYTSAETVLPTNQLPIKQGYGLVMEVLRVEFSGISTAATIGDGWRVLSVKNIATNTDARPNAPHVICACQMRPLLPAVVAGTLITPGLTENEVIDCTDSVGHGILVAAQKLYQSAYYQTTETGATRSLYCRVLYRWKYVGMTEYIGIVTSSLSS